MSDIPTEVPLSRVRVDSLSPEGLGHARVDHGRIEIHGALPGEVVEYRGRRRQRQKGSLVVDRVVHASPHRAQPRCRYFGVCGGCTLQHLQSDQQLRHKETWLLEALQTIAGIVPDELLPAIDGPVWGYRRRTRLGVRYVDRKERVLVGFRERFAPLVTDMQGCEILDPRIAALIEPLAKLIAELSIRRRLPQIEAAAGDRAVALVMRVLDPPTSEDLQLLRAFAEFHGVQIHLQPKGPDTIQALWPPGPDEMLAFRHPRERLALGFGPHHFIQINALVNERMVARVSDLLALGSDDRLLDLFCGVGNFTLPLARNAGETVGVEGAPDLVAQAWKNARANDVDNASFCCSDLQQPALSEPWANRQYSTVLLDPPRSGAAAMMGTIAAMDIPRVAYLSCHVDTLARDARTLVSEHGYRLTHAGVIDMFPHTTHFESMALLERC